MTADSFLDGRVVLHAGDCREILSGIPDASIDSIVTDPPYALVSIGKRFGADGAAPAKPGKTGAYARASAGFMGQKWDTGETAFSAEFWAECLRVLKPGGHVVAFSGTRTYHRMACAIEDAGFEIRDQLAWAYGSGFPKSHDVSKAIDRAAGASRRVVGTEKVRDIRNGHGRGNGDGLHASSRAEPVYMDREITEPQTSAAREWHGWGTALKPAWEPIALARKPLIGTVAENVLAHGTGAINIDGCRVATQDTIEATRNVAMGSSGSGVSVNAAKPGVYEQKDAGRWPANIVHDGSEEVVAAFPDTESGATATHHADGGKASGILGAMGGRERGREWSGDAGSAARFFYTAKAGADDRIGSKHPTVKPVDLMQWLVRLVTPKGGITLDPFAGTGTTGEAAWREGMRAVLIERDATFRGDIARRMQYALAGPVERSHAITRARGRTESAGPLFDVEAAE